MIYRKNVYRSTGRCRKPGVPDAVRGPQRAQVILTRLVDIPQVTVTREVDVPAQVTGSSDMDVLEPDDLIPVEDEANGDLEPDVNDEPVKTTLVSLIYIAYQCDRPTGNMFYMQLDIRICLNCKKELGLTQK